MHEPAPVVRVGERAAEQRSREQRHDLGQAEQADGERRAGELVDLERQRDGGEHRAGERDPLAGDEQAEVAVPLQRPDVDRDGPQQPAHGAPAYAAGRPGPAGSLRRMTARTLAALQAAGRLLLGGGIAAAPSLVAGGWVGAVADRPGGRVLAAGLGGRDVALALGTPRRCAAATACGRGCAPACSPTRRTSSATLRARDALPPAAVPVVAALAGGSVVLGAWLQRELD